MSEHEEHLGEIWSHRLGERVTAMSLVMKGMMGPIVRDKTSACPSCGVAIPPVFMGRYAFWLCEACRTPGEVGAWRDFIRWPEAFRRRDVAAWEVV